MALEKPNGRTKDLGGSLNIVEAGKAIEGNL